MPKRKRGPGDGEEDPHRDVEAKIIHGKKLLNKAMKLARNFERQKIDKRIKLAEKEGDAKKDRLLNEGEALKQMDILRVVDLHLHKTLLKTKSIAETNLLPAFVVLPAKNSTQTEAESLAYDNVTARMYNTKPVKEAMAQIMSTVYEAAGVSNPANKKAKPAKKVSRDEVESEMAEGGSRPQSILKKTEKKDISIEHEEPAWEGFDSGSEGDTESDDEFGHFSAYDARIAASSDEDSEDEETHIPQKGGSGKLKTLNPRDLSITPSPTPSRSASPSASDTPSDIDEPTVSTTKSPKQAKPKKSVAPTKAGSTFLPTLMGGYWSGTDSSASDDEQAPAAPPPRKNRRGQQARRAIAEKKFGGGAKHIKAGLGPADTTGARKREARIAERSGKGGASSKSGRDDGWDLKRGATAGGDATRRGFKRSRELVTGENAAPLGDRKKIKHRDDVGDLHASWAAAKKAKDERVNAKFEGKKVVFD